MTVRKRVDVYETVGGRMYFTEPGPTPGYIPHHVCNVLCENGVHAHVSYSEDDVTLEMAREMLPGGAELAFGVDVVSVEKAQEALPNPMDPTASNAFLVRYRDRS